MKIAVFADLHLTDNFNTVKMQVLKWALEEAVKQQVDCICCIGDLTAQGSDMQTSEVLKMLNSLPVSVCSTPGNAEVRLFADGRNADAFEIAVPENVPVVLINTVYDEPSDEELAKLSVLPDNGGFLLATHNPVSNWSLEAQKVVEKARDRGAVTAVIAGHSHHDADGILRGLDPDKASGGAPMFAIMEQKVDKSWSRSDCVIGGVDPADWSVEERAEFWSNIGFSSMWETIPALEFAISHRVKNLELRPPVEDSAETFEAVKRWRVSGGEILSMHLPDLKAEDDEGKLLEHVKLACKLGCDRVTLHVPRVTAAGFAVQKEHLLEKFGNTLQMLLEKDIAIGIENLHTRAGENTFETRNYGCTIDECIEWITLLRERFQTNNIGFHLDIGHARNNAPISGRENLSDWYCRTGHLLNGWHLHQVTHKDGKFSNHQPLNDIYAKLISLGGLFMANRAGQLRKAPMFLESRSWEGNVEAYTELKKFFK